MAQQAELEGVDILDSCAASEAVFDAHGTLRGVLTADMGVSKDGKHKETYLAGTQINARVTMFGEGCRGSLSQVFVFCSQSPCAIALPASDGCHRLHKGILCSIVQKWALTCSHCTAQHFQWSIRTCQGVTVGLPYLLLTLNVFNVSCFLPAHECSRSGGMNLLQPSVRGSISRRSWCERSWQQHYSI